MKTTINGKSFDVSRRVARALDAERAAAGAATEATIIARSRVRAALLADARDLGVDVPDDATDHAARLAIIGACANVPDLATRSAAYVEARYSGVVDAARQERTEAAERAAREAKAAADYNEGARDAELSALRRLVEQVRIGRALAPHN